MTGTPPSSTTPMAAAARPIAAIAVVLSIVLLVVAAVSCGPSDNPPASPPTSTTAPGPGPSTGALDGTTQPTPTTAPPQRSPATSSGPATSLDAVQRQVLDAYLGMQNAFVNAATTADADAADLPQYATGDALKLLRSGLTSMQQKSLRGTGTTYFNPKVEQLAPAKNPTTARVRDCMDTRDATAIKTNDPTYKDTPGGWQLVIADLELTGSGQWKVYGVGVHEVGSCAG